MIHMASPLIGFSYYIWAVPLVNLLAALLIFFIFKRNFIANTVISVAAALFSLLAGALLSAERFVTDMPIMESDWPSILSLSSLRDLMPVGLLSDSISSLFLMLISLIILILKLYAPAYFKHAHLRLNGSGTTENKKGKNSGKTAEDSSFVWQLPSNNFSAHLTFWHFLAAFLIISNDLWQSFIIIQLLCLNTYNLLSCQIGKRVSGPAHDSTELSEEEKSDSLFRKLYSPPAHSDSFDIKYHLAGFILMLLGAACIHAGMGSATFSHITAGDAAKGSLLNAAGLLLTAAGLLAQFYAAMIKKAHKTEIFTHIPSEAFIPHLPAQVTAVILHSCACLYLLFRLFPLICRQNSLMPAAVAFIAAGTAIAILCALAAFKSRKLDEILILLTLSQWGTVIMTLGLGSMTAACFHTASVSLAALLLFTATGSVVIRSGSQSLGAVGSLRDTMFYTWMACVFGGLSWLGLPPLLGFFSIYGLLGFTFNYSMLTLAAFAVICLVQAVHAFVLVKVYCLTFESEAPAKDSDREVPSEEIGPGLWVLPLALNSLLLALGLTDIPYAWQLPLPSIYEDFMQTAELRASGSPWLPIVIYLPCCCAAMYMSFRAYIKSGGKFIISDKAEQLLDKCRSILPLTDN